MRAEIAENQQDSSLALIWHLFQHRASLGDENPSETTLDTLMAPLDSNPGTAFQSAKRGAGVGLSIYIGQFSDASNLDYFQNRYYNPAQGQFLTEDPVFLGNSSQQNLKDPQSLNSYSYAEDNPITSKDPTGLLTQAQNTTLSNIKSELLGIESVLSSGNVSSSQLSSFGQEIGSASAAVTSISHGGNATLSPAYVWTPSVSTNVTPITPNQTNGVLPVAGGNSLQGVNTALAVVTLPVDPEDVVGSVGADLIETNGLKFTAEYYNDLREGGFPAPGLIAKEIIEAAGESVPDTANIQASNFVVYEYAGWRVVVDPVTNFVQHLGR